MVKDHSYSERGNPLPPHGQLFLISSKGSFIIKIPIINIIPVLPKNSSYMVSANNLLKYLNSCFMKICFNTFNDAYNTLSLLIIYSYKKKTPSGSMFGDQYQTFLSTGQGYPLFNGDRKSV